MYLKRLEINGFKSFASATKLEFGSGVTCIAGPNGSGKTNVAEAIRWVLGEQASRSLRARKTEDIIFSGSDKRPAQGMADVKLTLDNADGWLPLDFEEVVVARRAYRSGENEYYLNQSRVRLRDLSELFMKAQVGQNSYAFMGQGLVEQILTLRPDERRGLIEEAADVRLHRERLNEAQRRLSATRDNLERVDMLAREIAPRLRQLERQAERAEQHAKLSAELADALKTFYGRQWQDAQEALTAARAAADQSQGAFESATKEATEFEQGLASLANALADRRNDITVREERYRSLDQYRRDLQQRLTVDSERKTMLEKRRNELAAEGEALRAERQQVSALLDQQEGRKQELEAELTKARTPDATTRELAEIDARLSALRQQLQRADELASRAESEAAAADARLVALREQRERAQEELSALSIQRREQMTLLKTWAREFASLYTRARDLAAPRLSADNALQRARERLERSSLAVVRREEEIRTLTSAIEAAELRLDAAEGADLDLPPSDAGVQALLRAGGKDPENAPDPDGRIHGLVGMVGQLLRVPAGLERAIEAALADSLHAVVVETQEDALAGVELLVSEDLGRATLYPLDDIRPVHPINLLEEKGIIGVASELVRCDARYRPLINSLLGRTIVTENVGTAKALLRRGLGNIVTRDGTLLNPIGSMTAGSSKAVRRAFAHKRDVGELPDELERMRTTLEQATAALEGERREQTEARQDRDRLTPEVERLTRDFNDTEEMLRKQRSRLPTVAARLTTLHARLRDATSTTKTSEAALVSAQEALAAARAQAERQQSIQADLSPQIEELSSSRAALAQTGADRAGTIRTIETELNTLRRQEEIERGSLERIEGDIRRRVEAGEQLAEELQTVETRLASSQRELEEKTIEAEAAREELGPTRQALEQIESRQRTVDRDLAAVRSKALAAERALLEAQSNVKLRSEELEALRDRLEEEGFQPLADGEIAPIDEEPDGESDLEPGEPPAWLRSEAGGDDLPPMRGGAQVDTVDLRERIHELRTAIRKLGPVNEEATEDFTESRERHEYLTNQLQDLREAEAALLEAIRELEIIIKDRFNTTFRQVNGAFQNYFQSFFGGGHAELLLTRAEEEDEDKLPGVDIVAQPPRKRVRNINMLSGGERSLTAMALLFALLDTNPSPICVLDEVDAALDEANVGRFAESLQALSQRTQFIIITHNRRTLEMADTIYGVSMGEDSASTLLSLRISDIPQKAGTPA